jgi:hypothetical protein
MSKTVQILQAANQAGKSFGFTAEQQQYLKDALELATIKMNQKFELIDQGPVDDAPWYTVKIRDKEIWFWLTQQEGRWHHYICEQTRIPLVDMDEPTYLALVMRWS